jgi:hypothetical protein
MDKTRVRGLRPRPQGGGRRGEVLISASMEELDAALIKKIRAVGRPSLAAGNPHLTDAELDLLVGSGRWPALDRPVLLPLTGPQGRSRVATRGQRATLILNGDQHPAARVACMARFCRDWQEAQQGGAAPAEGGAGLQGPPRDVRARAAAGTASHLMGGYYGSEHDLNPSNLWFESIGDNNSRKPCHAALRGEVAQLRGQVTRLRGQVTQLRGRVEDLEEGEGGGPGGWRGEVGRVVEALERDVDGLRGRVEDLEAGQAGERMDWSDDDDDGGLML